MGQATYRAIGTLATNGSLNNNISVSAPASTAINDLLVAFVAESGGTPGTPAGWTAGPKNAGGTFPMYTFWKWAAAAGVQTTTFSWVSNSWICAAIVAVSGMNPGGDPVSASGVSDTTLTVPTMTSPRGNGLLLTAHNNNVVGAWTAPTGMTEVAEIANQFSMEINSLTVGLSATGARTPATFPAAGATPASLGLVVAEANVAPNAPTLNSPTTIDRALPQRLPWTFSDPDAGDSQSKFDLQYRLGAGAWVPITGTTPNNYWDAPPSTFAAGSNEWQVRTYDSQGLVGPWSASSFFTASDAPGTPTITVPINSATVSNTATVTWSAPSQTNYQLRRVADLAGAADTGTVYYDTGNVIDGSTRSVNVAFPTNNRWEHVQVRVMAALLWSSWADARVNVTFTAPMVPTLTATPNSATASIAITVTNPAPTGGEPAVSYNDIYVSSPLDQPAIRVATQVPPNSTWTWRTPGAGRVYQLRVSAVGSNATTSSSDNVYTDLYGDIY